MNAILAVSLLVVCSVKCEESAHTLFPKGFIFGTATASYQIEGAWNESGKGVNIWDTFTHNNPSMIMGEVKNGDIATDSYHQYKTDVQHIKEIGFHMYRFSLSWSRIFPNGTKDYVNPAGVQYYHDLIDELLANNIEPMVTIYHWDLPQPFEDEGGWLNRKTIDYYVDFADFAFKTYGSKVKWWVTINEAFSATTGYGSKAKAPALNNHGYGEYISGHHFLLAHAKAYRLYHSKYADQKGKVSMSFFGEACVPKNASDPGDIAAADRCFQFQYGWFMHPLMIGDYPPIMRQLVDENSKKEGLEKSRLPTFTKEEIELIKGTADYIGFNHYTTLTATTGHSGENPSWLRDTNNVVAPHPSWPDTGVDWIKMYPQGIRLMMNKVKNEYNNPTVIITENGVGTPPGVDDEMRITYYETILAELRDAIYKDGCNVIGHITWTLMDNFEWLYGAEAKFGLYEVDWNSTERTRTMRKSGLWYKHYIAMHNLMS